MTVSKPVRTDDNVKLHGIRVVIPRAGGHVITTAAWEGRACFCCRGPYHESTGHRFEHFPDVVYCGACTRYMKDFVKGMMSRNVGKTANFYEAAGTSIRADVYPGTGVVRYV